MLERPHDEIAEQSLLGVLLSDNSKFFDIYGTVRDTDFYVGVHGEIFAKIQKFVETGAEASPLTLKASFSDHPALEALGGADYLRQLAEAFFFSEGAVTFAGLVADLAERRRLIMLMEKYQRDLQTDALTGEIKSSLMSNLENGAKSVFVKSKLDVANEVLAAMQLPPSCDKTGLDCLDLAMAGGLFAGFTYGFAGAEKAGKTTLAHTISENLNRIGVNHAYIALEMGCKQIEQRNIARNIGTNSMAFLNQNRGISKKIADYLPQIKNHTIYLDMPGSSFTQIKAEVTRLVLRKQIKGFILDYWQLVRGVEKGQNAADFLYQVAQWCADFSRKHGVWCIILSQLNRQGEVFGSAGIDKACDQLYFIEMPEIAASVEERWLSMKRTRYTPLADVGSAQNPKLFINKVGPFFDEIHGA